jgi:IS6 family transposase
VGAAGSPLLVDAARPCQHSVGSRSFVDETYVKVAGRWRYVYRAIDPHGQIIDVYVSPRRDLRAARQCFVTAFGAHGEPEEIVTDNTATVGASDPRTLARRVPRHGPIREQSRRM